ncbi:hypothetical protein [Marispirochaeta sp.]|uniref:hypothetical protein n=1 Tax=Marispirochaeta sp. TaxID=2038653 RepID=UPI003747F2BA
MTATLIGSVLPPLAAACRFDPALVAPVLQLLHIVDITGLVIYFSTVRFVLGI